MAECAEPVRIGSHVSLEVPGIGPGHAQVRWQLGGLMGGMPRAAFAAERDDTAEICHSRDGKP